MAIILQIKVFGIAEFCINELVLHAVFCISCTFG